MAAEIRLLSAGAVEPGMVKAIEAFRRETGHEVKVAFATAPTIEKRLGEGEAVDVVVAPAKLVNDLVKAGKTAASEGVVVGRIGIGVMVRDRGPAPMISTVDDLKQTLLNAESVVYNQASTGIYLEGLFDRLGIGADVEAKTTRYPDAAAVLDHVREGKGSEIGLAATTVILEAKDRGIKLAGPLPAEIQNYTTYIAAVPANARFPDAAREFVRYLASSAAKAIFTTAGIQ